MRRRRILIGTAIGILAMLVSVFFGLAGQSSGAQPEVVAVRTDRAPALDGDVDSVWKRARAVTVGVEGGRNLPSGRSRVTLRALYDNERVYFVVQWTDPTESVRRFPWVKQPDGTWKQLITNTQGDENSYL